MRVSSKQYYEGLTDQVTSNQARLAQLQAQTASGVRVAQASDDPSGTARALSLQSTLSGLEQYERNGIVAKQSLSATESALDQMTKTLTAMRTLVVQAGNGALDDKSRQGLVTQIDGLSQALVQSMNARDGDQALFAGTSEVKDPFALTSGGAAAFAYSGNDGEKVVQIGPASRVATNVAGSALFATSETDVVTAMRTLKEQLSTQGTAVNTDAALKVTDAASSQVLSVRSDVGYRLSNLEAQGLQLKVAKENAQSTITSITGADLAQSAVDLKTAETVYQASLAVSGRISQQSLMDYLKQ
ncbi:MAG TPA: flagellar hook-associated protein FlgL [Armatimonadota bacterium]|jgi:flagellar hook-associated protein 3 FlgL